MTVYCPFQTLNETEVCCQLGKARFSPSDSTAKWACAGCKIPHVMANRPCIYIQPVKHFSLRGQSITYFKCSILGIVMDEPEILCPLCANRRPP